MMFVSVVAGILCGAGFIAVGAIMGLLSALVVFVMGRVRNDDADAERDREVRICIPESLNYTEVFDDIFEEYTEEGGLTRIRAEIMCERASHKRIIIGKGGEILKKVGSY
jgi:uncharacterized membrane protein YhiD involved in acid resistance